MSAAEPSEADLLDDGVRMGHLDGLPCPQCGGVLTREVTRVYDEERQCFCMVCTHVWGRPANDPRP